MSSVPALLAGYLPSSQMTRPRADTGTASLTARMAAQRFRLRAEIQTSAGAAACLIPDSKRRPYHTRCVRGERLLGTTLKPRVHFLLLA